MFGSVGAAQASANDTSAVQVRTVREALSSYELIESLFFSDGACISPERGVYFDLDAGKIVLNSNPIEMPQLHAKVKYYSKSDAYATFEINTSIQGCFVKELVIPVTSSEIVTLSRYQIIIRGNYKSCKIDGFESASGGANHFKVIREKDQTLKISCIQGEGN